MSEETKKPEETQKEPETADEWGSVLVEEHIKIFDPETQEVFINVRG